MFTLNFSFAGKNAWISRNGKITLFFMINDNMIELIQAKWYTYASVTVVIIG